IIRAVLPVSWIVHFLPSESNTSKLTEMSRWLILRPRLAVAAGVTGSLALAPASTFALIQVSFYGTSTSVNPTVPESAPISPSRTARRIWSLIHRLANWALVTPSAAFQPPRAAMPSSTRVSWASGIVMVKLAIVALLYLNPRGADGLVGGAVGGGPPAGAREAG